MFPHICTGALLFMLLATPASGGPEDIKKLELYGGYFCHTKEHTTLHAKLAVQLMAQDRASSYDAVIASFRAIVGMAKDKGQPAPCIHVAPTDPALLGVTALPQMIERNFFGYAIAIQEITIVGTWDGAKVHAAAPTYQLFRGIVGPVRAKSANGI